MMTFLTTNNSMQENIKDCLQFLSVTSIFVDKFHLRFDRSFMAFFIYYICCSALWRSRIQLSSTMKYLMIYNLLRVWLAGEDRHRSLRCLKLFNNPCSNSSFKLSKFLYRIGSANHQWKPDHTTRAFAQLHKQLWAQPRGYSILSRPWLCPHPTSRWHLF